MLNRTQHTRNFVELPLLEGYNLSEEVYQNCIPAQIKVKDVQWFVNLVTLWGYKSESKHILALSKCLPHFIPMSKFRCY